MKYLVINAGLEYDFEIDSAATSTEEIGNCIYPPARNELLRHGIDPGNHRARQITKEDCNYFDFLIGMDNANIRNILRICGKENTHKVSRLLDHTNRQGEVSDPWYTGDFESTFQDAMDGCKALLQEYKKLKA